MFDLPQFQAFHTLIGTDAQLWPGVVPHLADPVLTALWESRLSKVEGGSLMLDTFEEQLAKWLSVQVHKICQLDSAAQVFVYDINGQISFLTSSNATPLERSATERVSFVRYLSTNIVPQPLEVT